MQLTLKALRINAGYTAKEVSEMTDIHVQTLLKYEKDSSKIPMNLLKELSEIYQTPLDYIFLGKEFELNRTIQKSAGGVTMTQKLEVQIQIPDDYVLIKKADFEKIQDRPVYVRGMKWLENKTGLSRKTLEDRMLYPYEDELEHIIDYEDRWRFNIPKVSQWLEENSHKVFRKG